MIDSNAQIDNLLDRFAHFGVELGLERIQRLLQDLGNPQDRVPVIHVAGSNGKGSTCAYLSTVLLEAGYRVGRYTSPHLVSWTERISLNGQDIDPEVFQKLLHQTIAAIDPAHSSPTQFEVITAAAWLYFAEQQVDVAVMEVGLGGRLDATNVCDRPLVSVITSLSREHWQRLGNTLGKITFEKAGILKPGCPAVIAPQPSEAEAVLKERLIALDCPVIWATPELSQSYSLGLPGEHQKINAALAIATFQILQQQGWQITAEHITQGMAKTLWRGRLQWLQWRGRSLLIDGAHNPAGAEMLRRYVDGQSLQLPIHWVMGMIGGKDHGDVFRALLRSGDRLYLVPVPDHAAADLSEMALAAKSWGAQVEIYEDLWAGLEAACEESELGTVVLCGSLYLIGHFFRERSL
jgi:dihydrofolate synthase / folylpolyglutamate synthase